MYLWWEIKEESLASYLDRARLEGGCTILSDSEVEDVGEKTVMPAVEIYNKTEEPTIMDPPAVRIYSPSLEDDGGETGGADTTKDRIARGWVMWNAQYTCKLQGRFTLRDFPFDTQTLKLDVKILQVRFSKLFSLVVSTVQYHSSALDMSEWTLCEPIVKPR
jgi:hypothetical protein